MKRTIWIVGIVVLIVVGALIYLNIVYWNQSIVKPDEKHENLAMENELRWAVTEVINSEKQNGINISVGSIQTFSESQGYIKLDGESKINFETDGYIAERIVNKLVEKYPEKYGKGGKSWFDIEGCSTSGTSPDGINTYSHPTVWQASNGVVSPRI